MDLRMAQRRIILGFEKRQKQRVDLETILNVEWQYEEDFGHFSDTFASVFGGSWQLYIPCDYLHQH